MLRLKMETTVGQYNGMNESLFNVISQRITPERSKYEQLSQLIILNMEHQYRAHAYIQMEEKVTWGLIHKKTNLNLVLIKFKH